MGAVLVTGGAGFIGSHVVDLLLAEGREVVVIDDLSKGRRENLPAGVEPIVLDIADRAAVQAADLPALDAILHLAAQASVVVSTEDPARDLAVNVNGTIHLLDVARRHGCPLVFASTGGAIYGTDAPRPTDETSPVDPGAPYGASKAAAEIYIRLAAHEGLPHAICRLANVYGPRQRGDGEAGVVAILAERIHAGQPSVLYGFGEPTRDYVHVADVARALVAAIGVEGTFNIGTAVETSVREVYDLVRRGLPGAEAPEPSLEPLRPGELAASCLAYARAEAALGWQPTIPVAEGIPATAATLVG